MTIRKLSPPDAEAYRRLRLRGLQESSAAFSSSYAEEAGRSLADVVARVTASADGSVCVFGAFADEELVGLLAFVRSSRLKLAHGVELFGMYVAPEFRGRGLGGALLDTALAHARALPGVRKVKLTVNASNAAARSLYLSRGFVSAGIEPETVCVEGIYYDEETYVLLLTACATRPSPAF